MRRRVLLGVGLATVLAGPAVAGGGVVIEQVDIESYPEVSVVISLPASASPQSLTADDFVVIVGGTRPDLDVFALVRGPMEVVLALDTSGSMAGDPLAKAREGARGFIDQLPETVKFGLVAFGDQPELVAPIGTDRAEIVDRLGTLVATGETALYDAVVTAVGAFDPETDARRVIVILSDGADTTSRATLAQALEAIGSDIDVRAVALQSSETDHGALRQLASGSLITVERTTDLAAAYEEVAVELTGRFRLSFYSSARGSSDLSVFVHTPIGVLSTTRTVLLPSSSLDAVTTVPPPAVTIAPPPPKPAVSIPGLTGSTWAMPAGVAFVFVGLLMALWMTSRGASEMDQAIAKEHKKARQGILSRLGVRASAITDRVSTDAQRRGLDRDLDRAGLELRPGEFIIIHATSVVVGVLAGLVMAGLAGASIFGAIGGVAPRMVLNTIISRRREKFANQLEGTLQIVAGSLRSGYGLAQAVSTVAAESPPPTSHEFNRVVVENRLGRSVEDAMRAMATRLENEDLEWVVEAIEIQHEVGGNLAEVLDTVTGTIRDRNNIRRQVKALSAEGRMSAIILLGLPFVVAALIFVVTPDYLTELVSTVIGRVMLGGAAVMMLLGAIWIRKLVRVEF